MWILKTKVIPVIKWSTGTISKSFRKYLNRPGKHEIKDLQKTVILGTACVNTSESTNVKIQNIQHG
jgi:hypothetical protein